MKWHTWATGLVLIPALAGQPQLDSVITIHGNGETSLTGMATDPQGNIYLIGNTKSSDLGTPGAYQPSPNNSILYAYDIETATLRALSPPSRSAVYAIAVDSQHPGTVYVATERVLTRTTDNGVTWATMASPVAYTDALRAIVVAPSQPTILYVHSDAAFFRSTDAAVTWKALALPPGVGTVFPGDIAVDPADPLHVFLASQYVSHDGGESWAMLPFEVYGLTFDADTRTVYGIRFDGPKHTLVKSTDHGETFSGLSGAGVTQAGVVADAKLPGTVYVSGSGGSPGTYRSNDFGVTWTLVNANVYSLLQDTKSGAFFGYTNSSINSTLVRLEDNSRAVTLPDGSYGLAASSSGSFFFAVSPVEEMFVSKLAPDGSVLFTTYIGDKNGSQGTAITLDGSGEILIAGWSTSSSFPVTASIRPAGSDGYGVYLMKLSADGSRLDSSTRIAGAGAVHGLAVDSGGSIYLAGTSGPGYPTTPDAVQPNYPAQPPGGSTNGFATKIAPDGRTILYSTYLGGSYYDRAWAILPDSDGNAYVGGDLLWKLNPTGTDVLWKAGLGEFYALGFDSQRTLYAAGSVAGGSVYTSANAFQRDPIPAVCGIDPRYGACDGDALVAKFSPDGVVLYSTLLGGRDWEAAWAILPQEQGNAVVAGYTYSRDFPMRFPWQGPLDDAGSGFLTEFNGDGSDLRYSTYLGDAYERSVIALAPRPTGGYVVAGSDGTIRFLGSTASTPRLHIDSAWNVADRQGGPVSPGEWLSLRGAGFGADSRAVIGDLPLSVISISSSEIVARVPETFEPHGSTTLRVESASGTSPLLLVSGALSSAAVFTEDASGSGPALAFNDDGGLNTADHPAAKGSQVAIAVNGIGVGRAVGVFFPYGLSAVPASILTARVPGLPGDSYSLLLITIPPDVRVSAGNTPFALVIDGQEQRQTSGPTIWVAP